MADWQPIETAPKDGTRVRVGHILDPQSMKPETRFKTTGTFVDGQWQCSAAFTCVDNWLRFNPSHWMPEPALASQDGRE